MKYQDRAESEPRARRWRFVHLLTVAQRRLHAFIHAHSQGQSATRAGLLMATSPERGARMNQLAQALDLGAPGISNLVERAVEADLLSRRADPEDGRASIVTLTRAGLAARNQAIAEARTLNARLCEGFTEAELDVVGRWLSAVAEKFSKVDSRVETSKQKERT